jgi:predicted dehydrogenase
MNRRDFLKGSAAGLAASMLGGYVAGASDQKTHRVGLIGCGWYGKNDLMRLIQVSPVEVVSLCDVDQHMVSEAADWVTHRQRSKKTPRMFGDYRQMLKDKDLDIVLIGSPDHWHALQMIAAVEAGADVYVQKPISRDVIEGEAMVAAARKHGRVVQVGTQRKMGVHLIEAKKNIIEAGLLGKIGQVDLCCYYHMRANGNPPVSPVPDFLNYEMWTGPAPMREYDMLPHKRWWRTFMQYGNGIVGDMCIHLFDLTRWMLGLSWPKRVWSSGGIFVDTGGKSNISDTQTALFEYDNLNITWQHRTWGDPADTNYPWSAIIRGEKGTLKTSIRSYDFIPSGKDAQPIHKDCLYEREQYPEDVSEKDIDLEGAPCTRANMRDFLAAIENRGKPLSDIEQGHISTASCIMANLSMQCGRPLSYDPVKRQVIGDEQANALLRRTYRDPWQHPAEGM